MKKTNDVAAARLTPKVMKTRTRVAARTWMPVSANATTTFKTMQATLKTRATPPNIHAVYVSFMARGNCGSWARLVGSAEGRLCAGRCSVGLLEAYVQEACSCPAFRQSINTHMSSKLMYRLATDGLAVRATQLMRTVRPM